MGNGGGPQSAPAATRAGETEGPRLTTRLQWVEEVEFEGFFAGVGARKNMCFCETNPN
jgi:hypothetical protein